MYTVTVIQEGVFMCIHVYTLCKFNSKIFIGILTFMVCPVFRVVNF